MKKEWYKNDEERQLAEHLIDIERTALDKFMNGDGSLYAELWSKDNFTYHDAGFDHRVDTYEEIKNFLDNVVNGKLKTSEYEFKNPRVQFASKDVAVLTFQLFAVTNLNDMRYNCVEVFVRQSNGTWQVIHSTWAVIRPFEMDFSKIRKLQQVL